jgi:serine/threonine protein kinase
MQQDENQNQQQHQYQNQEGGLKKRRELKLINNGAFGCIFKPSLPCKGDTSSDKYITKIQKNERSIANELRISGKVRNISGYARFFAPVLKDCNVRFGREDVKDLKKCEVFEGDSIQKIESSSYVSMKTRFVGNKDLKSFLFSILSTKSPNKNKLFLKELWKTHTHLLKGIQKLFANNIIHFDLKYNNIIFDTTKKYPIIIDFGQSWAVNELKTEQQLSTAFFVFDEYDYWCIDILICNYIFQKVKYEKSKTEIVTAEEIDRIYDMFIYGIPDEKQDIANLHPEKKIRNDAFLYSILRTPKMAEFKQTFYEYAKAFIGKRTWWELYENLIANANTWDHYSLAIIYLNKLDDLFLSSGKLYTELSSDSRLSKYVELLEGIVYNMPNNRPSVSMVIKEVESFVK